MENGLSGNHDQRVKDAYDGLMTRLMACFEQHFQGLSLDLALYEYYFWPENLPTDDVLERFDPLFSPWLYGVWTLDPEVARDEGVDATGPEFTTTAALFDQSSEAFALAPLERGILSALTTAAASFWEVQEIQGRRELVLKDLFTLNTAIVMEEDLASEVRPGDLLYALVLPVGGAWLLAGAGPEILSPTTKEEIIQLRQQLVENGFGVDPDTLRDAQDDLRELYFRLTGFADDAEGFSNSLP